MSKMREGALKTSAVHYRKLVTLFTGKNVNLDASRWLMDCQIVD